jgi:signal peptidase I
MAVSAGIDSKRATWLTLGVLAAVYLAINLVIPRYITGFVGSYVVQPALWLLLAAGVMYVLPRYRAAGWLKDRGAVLGMAFMIGIFQVVLCVVGGLFSSFGKSPSAFTFTAILTNLVYVGAMLVGMELTRSWLINRLARKHTFLALTAVAVLYTILAIPLNQITGLRPEVASISFINSTLLPTLAESLLASFLALLAGPVPAIAYRGILQAFWWFSPVLPDLPWAFKGLIGTAIPIIGMVVMNSLYSPQPRRRRVQPAQGGGMAGWIVTTILGVFIIWFAVGLFPVHPSLVGSGSMRPVMDAGDIVIIAKTNTDNLKVGDVIQFRVEKEVSVMHRLIRIEDVAGHKQFITKGDANSIADPDPVLPENVMGRKLFNIPRVGYLAIIIKGFFSK